MNGPQDIFDGEGPLVFQFGYLPVRNRKGLCIDPTVDPVNLSWAWSASHLEDSLLTDLVVSEGARLENVQHLSHVATRQGDDGLGALASKTLVLCVGHLHQLGVDGLILERTKAEPSATGLQGRNDLGDVVADEAEPGRLGVLLDDPPQSELSSIGHAVTLVENNQFDASVHQLLSGAKALDLLTNHVDSSVIRSIELQSHLRVLLSVQLTSNGNHAGGLASARWPMEQEVRHPFGSDELADCKLN